MGALNVESRTLFIGDNLPVLRGINSESVDLIATDPPFNKGVTAFQGIVTAGEDPEGKPVSYKDVWTWSDVQDEWREKIKEDHPALHDAIELTNVVAGDDMGAFLCWLGVRVLECHRILRPTGSMYLHIDHTAHAYAKAMMDAIFGRERFRNEIVWAYTGPQRASGHFPRKHDTILFYSKSDRWVFNKDAIRIPSKWNELGGFSKDGVERKNRGKVPEDWWHMTFGPNTKERTGYPTQKPLAVYERIIKASSNEGDVVLDPFAGCATTCVAAENLKRDWIGIDINKEAEDVIYARLRQSVNDNMNWTDVVTVTSDPPPRTDDGEEAAPELTLVSSQPRGERLTPKQLRERLVLMDGLKCQGCGWVPHHADYLEADHRVPKAHGGRDDIRNRTLLCSPCNSVKGKKLTLAELRERRLRDGRMMDTTWTEAWYETIGRHGEPA